MSTVGKQWRYHVNCCYRQYARDEVRPSDQWNDLERQDDEPVTQHVCTNCKQWRSQSIVLTDIHNVLCSASRPGKIPALPPAQSLIDVTGGVSLTLDVAERLDAAFKRNDDLKISLLVGYLYKHTCVRLLQRTHGDRPQQVRHVTADIPLPVLLQRRSSSSSESNVADDDAPRRLPAAKRSLNPSGETAPPSPGPAADPPKRHCASDAAARPYSPTAVASEDHLTTRDRFKLQRPDGTWCDVYGRSTSPISTVKRATPKPATTLRGYFTARQSFLPPVEVAISGHLPTGWGRFKLQKVGAANAAYKSTPGDPTPPPEVIADLKYAVTLYLAQDLTASAGVLYTDVPLHLMDRVEYRAAGISSMLYVRPPTPAQLAERKDVL